MHWGINLPLLKGITSFFPSLLLNLQTVQVSPSPAPFLDSPLYKVFFCEFFLSIAPSHLLKVTKFLVKISQFKFLIITEKLFYINFFITKYFRFKVPLESFWSVWYASGYSIAHLSSDVAMEIAEISDNWRFGSVSVSSITFFFLLRSYPGTY